MGRGSGTQRGPRAPSPGEPSLRALAAMASAARRARTYDGATGRDEGDEETGPRHLVSRATASGRDLRAPRGGPVPPRTSTPSATHVPATLDRAAGSRSHGWGLERRVLTGRPPPPALLMGAAGVVVLAAAGLGLVLVLRSPAHVTPPASRPTESSPVTVERPRTPSRSTHGPPSSHPAPGLTTPAAAPQPSQTTTSTTAAATGAAPTGAAAPIGAAAGPFLTAVSPVSGSAGQRVVVRGSGFFSRNGSVVAYFGGTVAPTSCPSMTVCTVTVPDLGSRPETAYLRLFTESGRSNALPFSYA